MPQAFQARKFFIPKTDPKQEVYKPVPIISVPCPHKMRPTRSPRSLRSRRVTY